MNVSSVKNLNGETFSAVQDATLTDVVQTNSANWQDITAYQNNSASYQPSGNYIPYTADEHDTGYDIDKPLTVKGDLLGMKTKVVGAAIFLNSNDAFGLNTNTTLTPYHLNFSGKANGSAQIDISSINKWNEVSTTVQSNSADWASHQDLSYISAQVDNKLDSTAFSDVSGTFLTAHQAISAEEWNDCYDNVNTNSGAWGGSALPISAGPGIKVNLVDNTLVFSNDETVLWETTAYNGEGNINLSEPYTNFERLKVLAVRGNSDQTSPYSYSGPWCEYETEGITTGTYRAFGSLTPAIFERQFWKYSVYSATSETNFVWCEGGQKNILATGAGTTANSFTASVGIKKIVGINRK